MNLRNAFIVTVAAVIFAMAITGCHEFVDPETGQTVSQIDPENPVVAAVDKGTEISKPVLEASRPLLPAPFNIFVDLALLAIVAWQKVKEIKITKGSKAARSVISKYVKPTGEWEEAKKELLAAENSGLLKATMPDKV